MKNCLMVFASLLFAAPLMAQEDPAQEQQQAAKKEVQTQMKKFSKLLPQMVVLKDKDALRLMADAKANDGKLNITADEALKLVKKWEVKAKKFQAMTKEFVQLLQEQAAAGDEEAKKIMAEAKANDGKLKVSIEKMQECIKKWKK